MSGSSMEERLQRLAGELVETYPYYRRGSKAGLRFEDLPVMDKQTLNVHRSQLQLPHRGPVFESFTSGSTGVPFRCVKTAEERMKLSMAIHRHRRKRGLPLRYRSVLLGNSLFAQPKMIAVYANEIVKTSPHMIQGRSSGLFELANYFANKNIPVPSSLLFVQNWGELIQPAHRRMIEEVFRVPLLDYYGVEEVWLIAFTDGKGTLGVDEQVVHVEVLHPQTNEPVPDGESGDIAVTSFVMRSLPFVRYKTGDIGCMHRGPAGGERVLELLPLRNSQIQLPDRSVNTGILRYLDQFYRRLADAMDVRQFQMIQESHTSFRLLIVSEAADDERLSEETRKLAMLLKQCLFVERVDISIERVSRIAPHPVSGKYQPFVSLIS